MNSSKEYIIDEAYKLFLSRSYEAVSINDISNAMGFTKGALYYHFKNKEDIFIAVVDKYLLINELSIITDETTLLQYIEESAKRAREIITAVFGEKPLFVPVNYFALFIDAFRHYPGFANAKNQMFNLKVEKIKFVLDNAVKNGEIRGDIDTLTMSMTIFSIGLGIAANLFSNNSTTSAIDIMHSQLIELYNIIKKT
jgi:TetR/AcrR family transcriptional regulator, transcriptional repressor for nem operon